MEPLIKRVKSFIRVVIARCVEVWDSCQRLNASLYRENQKLSKKSSLNTGNVKLTEQNRAYKPEQCDEPLEISRTTRRQGENPVRLLLSIIQIFYKSFYCKGSCFLVSECKTDIAVCRNIKFFCDYPIRNTF